jgi:DNA-binding IclR family transcriptional regulator
MPWCREMRRSTACDRPVCPQLVGPLLRVLAQSWPTSTVQRLVANLVAEGFLDRDGDRYRIGATMAYWAAPASRGIDRLQAVTPALQQLRDLTGETACFFIREGPYRVCVAWPKPPTQSDAKCTSGKSSRCKQAQPDAS